MFFHFRSADHRRDRKLAQRFAKLLIRSFESGDLHTLNDILRPVVHGLKFGVAGVDESEKRTYLVSARFLREAYRHLFDDLGGQFKERFFYVGGYRVRASNCEYVWDHVVPVAFSEQSSVGVLVDIQSGAAALDTLRETGLFLVGHVHSHPGFGPSANIPSSTDAAFVKSLATGRSVALGAIFSRSKEPDKAFVRFYADPSIAPFHISIEGKGAEEIDENLFQLNLGQVPVAAQDVSAIVNPETAC